MFDDKIFQWDDVKAARNIDKHGIPFQFGVRVFEDPMCLVVDASREIDAERRLKAIGWIRDRLYAVVFTEREMAVRLISARRANRKEERLYGYRPL